MTKGEALADIAANLAFVEGKLTALLEELKATLPPERHAGIERIIKQKIDECFADAEQLKRDVLDP